MPFLAQNPPVISLDTRIQQQYDQMATTYDQRWQSYLGQSLTSIQAWLALKPTDRVLDLGCGTGELAQRLLTTQPELTITGVDLSPQMLAIARAKCAAYPQARFLEGSATALPFPDHHFDWVVSSSVFHYFSQPQEVLAEFRRILNPRGHIVILDWCRDYWVCQVYDWLLPWLDPTYHGCYSAGEFQALIQGTGLVLQQFSRQRTSWAWEFMIAKISHPDP